MRRRLPGIGSLHSGWGLGVPYLLPLLLPLPLPPRFAVSLLLFNVVLFAPCLQDPCDGCRDPPAHVAASVAHLLVRGPAGGKGAAGLGWAAALAGRAVLHLSRPGLQL